MKGHRNPIAKSRRHGGRWLVGSVVCSLACVHGAHAQDQDSVVTIDAGRCLDLTSAEERLACFEAQVGEALGAEGEAGQVDNDRRPAGVGAAAAGEASASSPARAASPAPVRTDGSESSRPAVRAEAARAVEASRPGGQADVEDEDFGLRPVNQREGEAPEMFGTVASIRERQPNRYVITLESGQMWYQTTPQRYNFRVGDRVRIYSTGWGAAYRLSVEGLGGFIQVERVR